MTGASPSASVVRRTGFGGFRHEALLYAGADDFLAATVPFVREGVERAEPVLAALSRDRIAALADALGDHADGVMFADMAELGQNPARIIPAWRDFVQRGPDVGSPRRGIGEPVWAGRSEVEVIECQRHESLLNVAFDSATDWWLLCPYDVTTLDGAVIDEARRNHPLVQVDGRHEQSEEAHARDMARAYLDDPLPQPMSDGGVVAFGPDDLRLVREEVAAHIVAAAMPLNRGFDFLLAVSEIATNSVRHGGGHGELRVWHDGDWVVCEVSDSGALTSPLAGREAPDPDDVGRRGLWLANQLCDLVQIRVFDSGTVVRLHMAVEPV